MSPIGRFAPFVVGPVAGGGGRQIGLDLVINGAFAADTDWTKGAGWTIAVGVATGTIAEGQPGRNMPRAGGAVNNLVNLSMADVQDKGTFDCPD